MAEKKQDDKKIEREYTIPLRSKYSHVPRYKKTPKAVKSVKEFIAKHMKVTERDLNKVKIDKYLNEMLWFRGIRKPPYKIKVKAIKEGEIVRVEAVELSKNIGFKKARIEKRNSKATDGAKVKLAEKAEKEKKDEGKVDEEKEKKDSVVEAGKELEKEMAKESKHTSGGKHKDNVRPIRQVMNK